MDTKQMCRLFEEGERIAARVEAMGYIVLRRRVVETIRSIIDRRSATRGVDHGNQDRVD